jgi:hypothetical protein
VELAKERLRMSEMTLPHGFSPFELTSSDDTIILDSHATTLEAAMQEQRKKTPECQTCYKKLISGTEHRVSE